MTVLVHLVQTSLRRPRFCVADFVTYPSLRKIVEKVSPILVTLTSRSNSNFEQSNIILKETEPECFDWKPNGLDYYVRNNEEKNSMVFGRLIWRKKVAFKNRSAV